MPNTIAIIGSTGNAGSKILFHLLDAYKAGKVNLIILHRPGRPPQNIPKDTEVELREIDLKGGVDGIKLAVKGINALVCVYLLSNYRI